MKHASIVYFDGHAARVKFDPIINMMRGEFERTGHRAKFMASDCDELKIAARDALAGYERDCKNAGVEPFRRVPKLPLLSSLLVRFKH